MDLPGLVARMFCVGFEGTSVPAETRELIKRGVGGIIFFKQNFSNGQQFADLAAEVKSLAEWPLLTSIDQEGGRVQRLSEPFTRIPAMRAVGRRGTPKLAQDLGQMIGRELRAANIDLDFAPVLDVDTNPKNPVIADRSFGATSQVVTEMGLAFIDGLQSTGVAACGKHFPGHGDTSQDSHHDLPRLPHSMERLNEVELPPFEAANRAGVAALMTAHVIFEAIDPKFPATMSRAVLRGILRDRLGFKGVIVSDDLGMKAVAAHYSLEEALVRGANAGVDLFCIGHEPAVQRRAIDLLARAIERGEVSLDTIEAANERLEVLFEKYVRPPRRGPLNPFIGCAEHRALVEQFGTSDTAAHDPTAYRKS
jgi:beta-N-acetylhexosaminidase